MHTKSPFANHGAHVLVDGQFGSTGKGALAAFLAHEAAYLGIHFSAAISNAGPNSGHTFYHKDEKHVLKQLPTFAVASALLGIPVPVHLSAGAIIDPEILFAEANRYPDITIIVHPMAAVITPEDKEAEHSGSIAAVAGTRSGTGAALAQKVLRNPEAVMRNFRDIRGLPSNVIIAYPMTFPFAERYFVEVSQGFSLGINSEFYPKTTSRECTVMQGIADARIAPRYVTRTYLSTRTFPIRVGNVDGFDSGGCYVDQREIDWKEIGVEPELTTVTQRQRRIFTFSWAQFREAVNVNAPDFVFANFMNYLPGPMQEEFLKQMREFGITAAANPFRIIGGWGPKSEDIRYVD